MSEIFSTTSPAFGASQYRANVLAADICRHDELSFYLKGERSSQGQGGENERAYNDGLTCIRSRGEELKNDESEEK